MTNDFLIRIKNAAMARNKHVEAKLTKKVLSVALALKKLGFLDEVKDDKKVLTVGLSFKNKGPVIRNIKLVTKPGLKVYKDVDELMSHKSPSIYLVSTSKGLMSSKAAIKSRMGGEVIAEIW